MFRVFLQNNTIDVAFTQRNAKTNGMIGTLLTKQGIFKKSLMSRNAHNRKHNKCNSMSLANKL